MLHDFWYRLARVAARVALWALGRLRVEGGGNVPATGPAILAANHISNVDPIAIGAAAARPVWFMAMEELFSMPVLARLLPRLHAFPVRRGTPDRTALRRAEEVLRAGGLLVMFPEGHESETGEMQPFLGGAALLALRTGAPVVPVWVQGTDGIMPYGAVVPRWSRKRVLVRFGPPLRLDDLAGMDDRRQAVAAGTERIRTAVARLAEGRAPWT